MSTAASLDQAYREQWSTVVATLARRLGDLQLAEDATQEALAKAAVAWERDGVPAKPGAWLTVTAWRTALNHLRRERLFAERAPGAVALDAIGAELPDFAEQVEEQEETLGMEDDRLGLIFACCHPALALEVRVALTLRFVAGLTTPEIASAFLVPEPTMAQRLVLKEPPSRHPCSLEPIFRMLTCPTMDDGDRAIERGTSATINERTSLR